MGCHSRTGESGSAATGFPAQSTRPPCHQIAVRRSAVDFNFPDQPFCEYRRDRMQGYQSFQRSNGHEDCDNSCRSSRRRCVERTACSSFADFLRSARTSAWVAFISAGTDLTGLPSFAHAQPGRAVFDSQPCLAIRRQLPSERRHCSSRRRERTSPPGHPDLRGCVRPPPPALFRSTGAQRRTSRAWPAG